MLHSILSFFFFNDTATTEIYTLSLHDALPISEVKRLRAGLWQISLPFQGEEEIIGSYLLAGNDELLLIDPGPSSTLDALLDGLREAGFRPQDLTHILVTHVHLDHAGATGSLARHAPKAQVYVHKLGAPHLKDTSKLVAS